MRDDNGRGRNHGRGPVLGSGSCRKAEANQKGGVTSRRGSGVGALGFEEPVPRESQAARRPWPHGARDTYRLSSI